MQKKEDVTSEDEAKEEATQADPRDAGDEEESDKKGESVDSDENAEKSNGEDSAGATRKITDSVGREVEIPNEVNTIVPLGNTPRMITYLGLAKCGRNR